MKICQKRDFSGFSAEPPKNIYTLPTADASYLSEYVAITKCHHTKEEHNEIWDELLSGAEITRHALM